MPDLAAQQTLNCDDDDDRDIAAAVSGLGHCHLSTCPGDVTPK